MQILTRVLFYTRFSYDTVPRSDDDERFLITIGMIVIFHLMECDSHDLDQYSHSLESAHNILGHPKCTNKIVWIKKKQNNTAFSIKKYTKIDVICFNDYRHIYRGSLPNLVTIERKRSSSYGRSALRRIEF